MQKNERRSASTDPANCDWWEHALAAQFVCKQIASTISTGWPSDTIRSGFNQLTIREASSSLPSRCEAADQAVNRRVSSKTDRREAWIARNYQSRRVEGNPPRIGRPISWAALRRTCGRWRKIPITQDLCRLVVCCPVSAVRRHMLIVVVGLLLRAAEHSRACDVFSFVFSAGAVFMSFCFERFVGAISHRVFSPSIWSV